MTNVLVVEDSAPLGRLLATTLTRAGHRVLWSPTGAQAEEAAGELKPDVVFIDLHLDDTTGADLATALRRDHPITRLIAMSGETPTRDVRALFDAFLLKPVALETLLQVISG